MKTLPKHRLMLHAIFSGSLAILATALTVWSQTAPVLTITPLGTNQFSITFTNTGTTYDLQWTPVLASPDYPWTWAAVGTNNQTNFSFDMSGYQTAFFRAILDTNSVPLWEAADPNNPGAGILTVTIDSPVNGSNLTP
jgi:predicted small integral membrane protein